MKLLIEKHPDAHQAIVDQVLAEIARIGGGDYTSGAGRIRRAYLELIATGDPFWRSLPVYAAYVETA